METQNSKTTTFNGKCSIGPFIVTAAATSIVQRLMVIYTSSTVCRKIPHDFLDSVSVVLVALVAPWHFLSTDT